MPTRASGVTGTNGPVCHSPWIGQRRIVTFNDLTTTNLGVLPKARNFSWHTPVFDQLLQKGTGTPSIISSDTYSIRLEFTPAAWRQKNPRLVNFAASRWQQCCRCATSGPKAEVYLPAPIRLREGAVSTFFAAEGPRPSGIRANDNSLVVAIHRHASRLPIHLTSGFGAFVLSILPAWLECRNSCRNFRLLAAETLSFTRFSIKHAQDTSCIKGR
jgi:hypothetical protein